MATITYEGHAIDYDDDDDLIMVAEPPPPSYGVSGRYDRDAAIYESLARRDAGERFLTVDEFFANMDAAIEEGARRAR